MRKLNMIGWFAPRLRTGPRMLLLWLGLLLAGCGGDADRPSTVAVSGTVKLDGQPLADVKVTFVPQSPEGRGASGTSNAAGEFELMTFAAGDGAMPGEYKVIVVRPVSDAEAEKAKGIATGGGSDPGGPAIPAKYKSPNTTELTETVGDEPTTVALELQGGG